MKLNSSGEVAVFRNSLFRFDTVVGAEATMIADGRIKHRDAADSEWLDLGPIASHGVRKGDVSVDECLQQLSLYEEPTLTRDDIENDWVNYDDGDW